MPENIREYLPFIIPIVILQLTLTIAAIIHILRHDNYKFGNRPMWILVSFIQTIGPLVYFIFGRGED
ncbi:PLD nuclease N-terminal domain-containing protein [Proteiniclasticum sp.]|uniref:PLD nuclease N-terminal domain-containing protein n=1 Tax=Proteiniclasticum sp. TaxID=2053595 RepID=UPI000EC7FBF8|nr:PLD nuclease N-terminal domain-containing protein [Proteiniclasticum sp.]HCW74530.1 hypothetical protein [Clostridiaceae bacterium]